jgi:Chaperone of endosialidase
MDKASESILAVRPVTFRYKPDLDPDGLSQFGLVAEEVEKVDLLWSSAIPMGSRTAYAMRV